MWLDDPIVTKIQELQKLKYQTNDPKKFVEYNIEIDKLVDYLVRKYNMGAQ